MRKHKFVTIPYSKLKHQIIKIFLEEGYILDFKIDQKKDSVEKSIIVTLKYVERERVIRGLKRISKPGLKVYSKADQVPRVLNGLGTAVISTSKGLLIDTKARSQNLGGEVLLFIW